MKNILDFIKNNFFNVIFLIIVLALLVERCAGPKIPIEKPTTKRDTVWVQSQNFFNTLPTIVKTIPGQGSKEYLPDPNYEKLVLQYQELVKSYIAKNIHKDSVKIDSIGYVRIEDTVSHNLITGRKTSYSLKYPITTNTITLPPVRKNQLYYGGGFEYSPMNGQEFNAGILLKTKSDQIYSVYGGLNSNGSYQVGVQSFWKIKLHK